MACGTRWIRGREPSEHSMARLRLHADRVIDGRTDHPRTNCVVEVDGTRIARVGPVDDTADVSGVEEVRLAGCTLMPGLIDVHAHLTFGTPGRTYEQVMSQDSDDLMLVRAVRNCQIHLAAG